MAIGLGIASLVTSMVGTGISYFAGTSAANNQSVFASLNAQAQLQQAQQQGRAMSLQANLRAAQANAAAQSARNNAEGIRKETEAGTRIAQENLRKSRMAFAQNLASKRAAAGSGGVSDATGSPLDLIVQASEDQALYEQEQRWADEIARRKGFRQAQIAEVQGKAEGINASLFQLDAMSAVANSKLQASQARLNEFGAQNSAAGMQLGALGGLIGGLGSIANQGYNLFQARTPRTASAYRGAI